ncbi:MAG: HAD family phosphatase [Calditrichaeota bacterium]|nr:MAG: HAD family phosphatase [Calditrichota bacterium]
MKALFFDFDGVVVKSMEDHYEGWRRVLAEYGIDMAPEELYLLEGQAVEAVASQLIRKFNLPSDQILILIEKKRHYYEQIKKPEIYPHLVDVLQWAREKNLAIGLVTGGDRYRVDETLKAFGLQDYFDAVVTAEDVAFTKPSPEPYLRAAQLVGVEPSDCVVIENAPLGIRSAKSAGMKCIAVTTTLPPAFLREADVVVENLAEALDALKRLY